MEPSLYVCSSDPALVTHVKQLYPEVAIGAFVPSLPHGDLAAEAAYKLKIDTLVSADPTMSVVLFPLGAVEDPALIIKETERVAAWHRTTRLMLPATLAGIEAAHMLARGGAPIALYPVATPEVAAAFSDAVTDAHYGSVTAVVPVGALYRLGYNGFAYRAAILEALKPVHVPVSVISLVETVAEFVAAREAGYVVAATPEVAAAAQKESLTAEMLATLEVGSLPSPLPTERADGTRTYAISSPLVDELLASLRPRL